MQIVCTCVIYGTFCSGRKKCPFALGNNGSWNNFLAITDLGVWTTQKGRRIGEYFLTGTLNYKIKQAPHCKNVFNQPQESYKI